LIPVYQEYKKLAQKIQETRGLLLDPEIKDLASSELETLRASQEETTTRLQNLLRVEDPLNTKNAIIEIQAGVGGDESALFVEILFGMYARYAKKQGWEVEITDTSEGNQGGFKNISFIVEGLNAYSSFRFESGTHKIQRISPTDSAKRMHTSAASVVVFPEEDFPSITLNKNDVRVDTFCSGGPGGQHQNVTKSGVRLTHLPTNIVVSLRDGRHQRQNYARAWNILSSRINSFHKEQQEEKLDSQRRNLRGTGVRSGCIRTYNFPQDRFTDHRYNYSWHGLEKIFAGNLDQIFKILNEPLLLKK
jgi:peptide chain release factor 1